MLQKAGLIRDQDDDEISRFLFNHTSILNMVYILKQYFLDSVKTSKISHQPKESFLRPFDFDFRVNEP